MPMAIKARFTVNEYMLIMHTLSFTNARDKDIVAFQDYVWEKSETNYDLLAGRGFGKYANPTSFSSLMAAVKELPKFMETLRQSKQEPWRNKHSKQNP